MRCIKSACGADEYWIGTGDVAECAKGSHCSKKPFKFLNVSVFYSAIAAGSVGAKC